MIGSTVTRDYVVAMVAPAVPAWCHQETPWAQPDYRARAIHFQPEVTVEAAPVMFMNHKEEHGGQSTTV